MRRLIVFNNVTIDGYFTGPGGDFSWAHAGPEDPEFKAFVAGSASGEAQLLFGRVTYEMMAGYWSTPLALERDPVVAAGMNRMPKIVFSRTLGEATWNNTTLLKEDLAGEVARLKQEPGGGMVILGSGSIVAQLAQAGLIDEYQLVVNPVVLGCGRTLFEGLAKPLVLRLKTTRAFPCGKLYLCYEPRG
jgi:dihydrofolate reductase